MFEVNNREVTREFAIYKMRTPYANKGEAYLVELDGVNLAAALTVTEAHKHIKKHARENKLAGAGVTEVFGRNRSFVLTNRFALKAYKPNDSATGSRA